jgi:hypothetical protein
MLSDVSNQNITLESRNSNITVIWVVKLGKSPTFQRKMPPLSSGLGSKRSKTPAETGGELNS